MPAGRIQLRHHSPIGMTQIVILEHYPAFGLNFPRVELHGVYRLDFPIWQTVHKLRGGNFASVQILNDTLVLFPQVGKVELVLLPPLRQILKIHFQFVAHLDCTLCVAGFEGHKLDTPLLVLHLPVNQNRAIYQIDVRPFQTVALIDTQTAIPSQQIRRFCIGAVEIIIQYGKLFPIE